MKRVTLTRKSFTLISIFIILVVACLIFRDINNDEKSILNKAHPIHRLSSNDNYQWADNKSIDLIYINDINKTTTVVNFNLDTHQKKIIATINCSVLSDEDTGKLSTDGKLAIFNTGTTCEIISVDGKKHYSVICQKIPAIGYNDAVPYIYTSRMGWMHADNRWVELVSNDVQLHHLVIHELTGKTVSNTILTSTTKVYFPHIIGVLPNNHLMLWECVNCFYDVDLLHPASIASVVKIHNPPNGEVFDIIYSPDGKHLLWRTYKRPKKASYIQSWISQNLHAFSPIGTNYIWISDANGNDMRLLGRLSVQDHGMENYDKYGEFSFRSFRWKPDGKSISFIYDDKIWELPVK